MSRSHWASAGCGAERREGARFSGTGRGRDAAQPASAQPRRGPHCLLRGRPRAAPAGSCGNRLHLRAAERGSQHVLGNSLKPRPQVTGSCVSAPEQGKDRLKKAPGAKQETEATGARLPAKRMAYGPYANWGGGGGCGKKTPQSPPFLYPRIFAAPHPSSGRL